MSRSLFLVVRLPIQHSEQQVQVYVVFGIGSNDGLIAQQDTDYVFQHKDELVMLLLQLGSRFFCQRVSRCPLTRLKITNVRGLLV